MDGPKAAEGQRKREVKATRAAQLDKGSLELHHEHLQSGGFPRVDALAASLRQDRVRGNFHEDQGPLHVPDEEHLVHVPINEVNHNAYDSDQGASVRHGRCHLAQKD